MVILSEQEDHYMWAYMYMFAHLAYKPRTEYTGVEEYLMDRVRGGTHSDTKHKLQPIHLYDPFHRYKQRSSPSSLCYER